MISNYNGTCRYCKSPTLAKKDHYDLESKTSYHAQCEEDTENEPPDPRLFRLAESLGFIGPGQDLLINSWRLWPTLR